jgi:ATP-dependent DNA helicase PIF1
MVNAIYTDLQSKYMDSTYLRERVILTPTNDMADKINNYIMSLIPDYEKEYLSSDSILKGLDSHDSYDLLYPVEFLNSLNGNNFPQHKLSLKKGVPVMLLQNLNQAEGLCNGTQLTITMLGDMVIEGQIMCGTHQGKSILIPRISLVLKNNKWPFGLQRHQYPIKICYSVMINKSQGQTLAIVGIYLQRPVFTHGQLYVAVSHVTTKSGLKFLIEDEKGNYTDETKNIVYKEEFSRLETGRHC